jgi:hypothetical protein
MPDRGSAETTRELLKIMADIEDAKLKSDATEGTIRCPRCGGLLNWVSHGPRSLRAACQTEGCIKAMS